MRGGSIPLLAFGTLLAVLAIGNWVWNAKPVSGAVASFASLVVYLGAALIAWRSGRRAVRRGPPDADTDLHTLPGASAGPVIAAFGLASFVFGFTFGNFLVYFGIVLMVVGLARAAGEARTERLTRERMREERER